MWTYQWVNAWIVPPVTLMGQNDGKNLIGLTMDNLLEQFGKLVFEVAQDMQNDGYFSGSQDLGEAY